MGHRTRTANGAPGAQPPTAEFLFDFGSPNAYLCHKVIPAIEARSGVRFRYVPILLGGRCLAPCVDAMYAAMWEQGRNMADDAEIAAVLSAAGLDAAAIVAKSQEPEVKAALLAGTERAHARGAFGSPSFFVGDELWFGKERLRDVEEALLA